MGLLQQPGMEAWDEFTCLNSLRDVEPTSLLIMNDHNLDDVDFASDAASDDSSSEPDEDGGDE